MKIKKFRAGLTAAAILALCSGCAAVVIGAAGAVKELQFSLTTQQKDALKGRLVARTAMDKKVAINLVKVSDTLTEIRIRMGTLGDQDLSQIILDKIKSRL